MRYGPARGTGLCFHLLLQSPFLREDQKLNTITMKRSHLALCTRLTPLQATLAHHPLLPQQAEWESMKAAWFGIGAFQKQATESPQFSIPVAATYPTLAEITVQQKQIQNHRYSPPW